MELTAFRVQMFKSVIDSGWVKVEPLTVMVGKNESGKTTLLKALHKFNPFVPEPYDIRREWPRGHRDSRSEDQVVCTARFKLGKAEMDKLAELTAVEIDFCSLEVTRDYSGRFEVQFPASISPNKLHPTDIDDVLKRLPKLAEPVGNTFKEQATHCMAEAVRLAKEGRFSELQSLHTDQQDTLQKALTACTPDPQHQHEQQFINQYVAKLQEVSNKLGQTDSIHKKAHDYVVGQLPTIVYMDEYRSFRGTAMLDQVVDRQRRKQLNEDDKTLLTILELAHLDISDLAKMGAEPDREERHYDLDDGGATLTAKIEKHWGQLKYDVEFRADGQQLFTW